MKLVYFCFGGTAGACLCGLSRYLSQGRGPIGYPIFILLTIAIFLIVDSRNSRANQ